MTDRRARRAVLAFAFFALASQALYAVGLEHWWPEFRDPEYGVRLKRLKRLAAKEPSRPLVVVVGSSRAQMGLSPTDLGLADHLAINLARTGGGPCQAVLTLRRLRADGVAPAAVLFELMPGLLARPPVGDLTRPPQLAYGDLGPARGYHAESLRGPWWQSRLSPLTATRVNLMSRLKNDWLPPAASVRYLWDYADASGWFAYPHDAIDDATRTAGVAVARREYAERLASGHIDPATDRAARDLLADCRCRGVPVAVLLMPEGPSFRALYPEATRQRLDDYLADLVRETGAPLFDARTWGDEGDFVDGHHLLRGAARRFSAWLGRESVGPWLVSGRARQCPTPEP